MSNSIVARCVALHVIVIVAGCANISFDDYMPYSAAERQKCTLGGPRSTQGDALCNALLHVEENVQLLEEKVESMSVIGLERWQLVLAVLSAGALAADSHVSSTLR